MQTECADSPDPHPEGTRPVFLGLGSLADTRALPAGEAQRIGAGSPKGAPNASVYINTGKDLCWLMWPSNKDGYQVIKLHTRFDAIIMPLWWLLTLTH